MMGKVFIVGAGPGDPELITLKAYNLIKKADVIIYDRLVPKTLLEDTKAELIYVGKEIGDSKLQDYINELLVEKAKTNSIVVRLKGGDPYVFGRGEEECIYVLSHGIECEVVPGVSSAIAVPAYAGIPVTSRLTNSSSFTVITGTRADNKIIDASYIPREGTLIILMGIHVIEQLERVLLSVRDYEEYVAIIENGTTEKQRVITGRLKDLSKLIIEHEIRPPAIIVVGDVVKLRDKLWKLT
ncbi:uroporphyrinogen-III C-methyltransferase [Sulfurisphaera ohwakuensis]|uniref:uroporphyrinogen-III C-methyltransferase n=1 Tax=Sulfurisphaera ohwakuensis TaxID=69656 RepID=UPI0036F40CC1